MSKPEKPELKTGKRIVSKGEYMKAQSMRTGLNMLGSCLLFAPVGAALYILANTSSQGQEIREILIGCVGVLSSILGTKSLVHSQKIDPGVPLTYANTADLPAPESLVRASAEPLQAQEAVLLRAAAQGQETPSEQLVRSAVGQEQ